MLVSIGACAGRGCVFVGEDGEREDGERGGEGVGFGRAWEKVGVDLRRLKGFATGEVEAPWRGGLMVGVK